MRRSDFEIRDSSTATGDLSRKKKKSLPKEAGPSKSSLEAEVIKKPRPKPTPRTIISEPEEDYDGSRRRVEPRPLPPVENRNIPDNRTEQEDAGTVAPHPSQASFPETPSGKKRLAEDEDAGERNKKKARLESRGKGRVEEDVQAGAMKAKTRMGKQQEAEKSKRSLRPRVVK